MSIKAAEWTNPPTSEEELISWFHGMRERAHVQEQPETGEWHVFGYNEGKVVLANYAAFSNAIGAALVPPDSPFMLFRIGHLPWMDPPRHKQLRALVQKAFTRSFIRSHESMVRATVDEVLDRNSAKSEIAFVEEIATPIVSGVIGKIVGIPADDVHQFGRWASSLMALTDPAATQNGMEAFVGDTKQMHSYLHAYIADRRAHPGDDLTSRLTQVEIDGAVISDAEVAGLIALLMNTGVTSNQLIANALICLDQQPDAASRVRSDPGLIPPFIEEVSRYRGQTPRVARFSMENIEIGGHEIPLGRPVSVWLSAANRDPRRFLNPDVFDVSRSPNPHLGLGHGIHVCLGAELARLQTAITIRRLLELSANLAIDYERSRLLDPRLVIGASELTLCVVWNGKASG